MHACIEVVSIIIITIRPPYERGIEEKRIKSEVLRASPSAEALSSCYTVNYF